MQNLARLIFASYLLISFIPAIAIARKLRRNFHRGDAESRRYSVVMPEDEGGARIGLCADCQHMRLIKSDRGSVFYFCQLSASDARFPKYPRLPVLQCAGYEQISTAEAQRRGEDQSGS